MFLLIFHPKNTVKICIKKVLKYAKTASITPEKVIYLSFLKAIQNILKDISIKNIM